MALTYTPTTELQAINIMLSIIGEQPVNSIAGEFTEALLAQTALHNTSRAVQKLGFQFNSEEHYPLVPTLGGFYMVPPNALKANPTEYGLDVTLRGSKFYDRKNHTFVFTTTSMDINIVFFLPFSDIPEAIRYYIVVRAARRFAEDVIGSTDIANLTEDDEQKALVAAMQDESDADDHTLLDNPEIYKAVRRNF